MYSNVCSERQGFETKSRKIVIYYVIIITLRKSPEVSVILLGNSLKIKILMYIMYKLKRDRTLVL